MSRSLPPILVCYDGSPGAARAMDAAGTLFPRHPAIVLYVSSRALQSGFAQRPSSPCGRSCSRKCGVAARLEAAAVVAEGASLARRVGLDARPLTVETGDGAADVIVGVAAKESAAAVVVGLPSRTRRGPLPGSASRRIVDRCPVPVVLV
jgi:nucleotide-binding universal stress UspA family protein